MEAYKKLLFEDPKTILFVVLGIVAVCFVVAWAWLARKGRAEGASTDRGHTLFDAIVAFVCTFFDTLGIGSFATTTAAFKFHESVPDEKIPGTLNVGYAIPTFAQAFIFIAIVKVDFKTLALMIAAAVAGSWFGAGIVAQWPRRRIQLGMGGALLVAAGLMLMKQFEIGPPEGESLTLAGTYDPIVLEKLGIQGFASDIAAARTWYERAKEFGSAEAMRRLEMLASRAR